MDKDTLAGAGIVLMFISAFAFFISLIVVIASKELRKRALTVLIISIITAVIGFGTCLANFSLNTH